MMHSLKAGHQKKSLVEFAWKKIKLDIEIQSAEFKISNLKSLWDEAVADKIKFDNLRRIIMKLILLPPLYVGKTNNLSIRCSQHRKW